MTATKLSVVKTTRPSPLVRLVDDYLSDCKARGLSPKSIRYGIGWPLREIFLPWCADNFITEVEQLDGRTLNRFSAHLSDHGGKRGKLAKASIWTYSKAVRRFLSWAKQEGEKVTGDVKLPKLPQTMVEILSPQEVRQLEDLATNERDKLIVRTLAETGLRRSELVGLTVRDLLDEDRRAYLLIHGKGSKDRKVPVQPSLSRRLRRYIAGRPRNDRMFIGLRKRSGNFEPLTASGVTQMVTGLSERADLGKAVHPHTFRHTAATFMLKRGMDSILVAQVLGHSSLQMIQRVYSHLTPSDAHEALMAALATED